jgi:hypothetical protein
VNAVLLLHLAAAVQPAAAAASSSPDLGLVSQIAGLFGIAGSAVALRARRQDPAVDAWQITTAWSMLGMVVGLASVAVAAAT